MKAFFVTLFFFTHLHAMESARIHDESMRAIKRRIIKGPDKDWHLCNSFMQAIIYPSSTKYYDDGILFFHYEYSQIPYFETYQGVQEFFGLLAQQSYNLEESALITVKECLSSECLTEKQKLRIARAWLHQFFNDTIDSPFVIWRKRYIDTLRTGDYEELARIAPQMCKYTVPLLDEIKQRYKEVLH